MDVNEGLDGDHHIIFYILCDIYDSLGFEYYNTVFISLRSPNMLDNNSLIIPKIFHEQED